MREGGGWRDLLAPRPLSGARTPGDPGGTRFKTAPGVIAIRGTYGRGGGVKFGFRALPDGALLSIAPVRAGARRAGTRHRSSTSMRCASRHGRAGPADDPDQRPLTDS